MTGPRRAVLFGTVLLVVVASTTAGWAATDSQGEIQEETTSFDVVNLSAPPSITAGETVTVNATVTYQVDAATGTPATGTATDAEATATAAGDGMTETATEGATTPTTAEGEPTQTVTEGEGTETATAAADGAVTQSVEFRVQGDVVERQDVTLAPGESTTVTFELDTTDVQPGVYIHGIYTDDYGEVATLIVTTATEGVTETPTTNETATGTPATETDTPGAETATPSEATETDDVGAGTETAATPTPTTGDS